MSILPLNESSILYSVGQHIYFNDPITGWSTGTIQTILTSITDKRGFLGSCGSVSGPDGTSRFRLHASDEAAASVVGFGRAVREIQPSSTASVAEMTSVAFIVIPVPPTNNNNNFSNGNNGDSGGYWTVVPVWSSAIAAAAVGGGSALQAYDSLLHPLLATTTTSNTNLDPDLFRIDDLHIAALSTQLQKRYESHGDQYSRLGPTILSVNPFEAKSFNSPDEREKYLQVWKSRAGLSPSSGGGGVASGLPPHVWSVAEKAYSGAIFNESSPGTGQQQQHQSVVISGESGSGKTENTKMIIDFLGCLSSLHSCNAAQRQLASDVSSYLKASNPILELFGNAKTVRNDNSSRFGKYTKLWFNKRSGVMIGAEMETYLLERSRVVSQGQGERNYHIFYGLIAALRSATSSPSSILAASSHPHLRRVAEKISSVLGGGGGASSSSVLGPEGFRLLQQGGEYTRRGVDGKSTVDELSEFAIVQQALSEMGVSDLEQGHIWFILGAILLFGEISFVTSETTGKAALDGLPSNDLPTAIKGGSATSQSVRAFVAACDLLGLQDPKEQGQLLRECFLEKNKSAILTTMATASEASDLRDALCKHLYVTLFDHLVKTVNAKLAPAPEMMMNTTNTNSGGTAADPAVYVGVLDIFGFECFKKNGFEQLCINYANEALQGHYNAFTFAADEEECAAEGIPCSKVNYPDNTSCLTLFNLKKVGIFDTLDEESGFKGGTAERYTQCLWDRFGTPSADSASSCFLKPKGTNPTSFSVRHFASTVSYDTNGWVSRNADSMKEECVTLLANCSSLSLIQTIMAAAQPTAPSQSSPKQQQPPQRKLTVSKYFRSQLDKLMSELRSTSSHFIRCIKPNTAAKASFMDVRYTCLQLESAGVVQTIALKRQGFAVRRPLREFTRQFWPLIQSRLFMGRGMVKNAGNVRAGTAECLLAGTSYCLGWNPSPRSLSDRRSRLRAVLTEELRNLPAYIRDNRSLPTPASDWLLLQHGGKRIPTTNTTTSTIPLFTPDEVDAIIVKLAPEGPNFAVGNTKFFFKEHAWNRMERLLRRWKRRCLAKCIPFLKRWAITFRKAKARQEEDRKAALRDLQEQATQRRVQEGGGESSALAAPLLSNVITNQQQQPQPTAAVTQFLRDVSRSSSLPAEKQPWFEDVAGVFRNFDLPVLLDVVYNLNSREKVVRALTEMQSERLNATLPGTLLRLFQEVGISTSIAENFAANGISSVNDLAALPRARLLGYGLTPKQVGAVMNRMMGQQGELLINERLRVACLDVGPVNAASPSPLQQQPSSSSGHHQYTSYASGERALPPTPQSEMRGRQDGAPSPPIGGIQTALAAARSDTRSLLQDNEDAKVQRMTEMGIAPREVCAAALAQCEGDVHQATAFILDGRIPRDSHIGAVRGGVRNTLSTSSSPPRGVNTSSPNHHIPSTSSGGGADPTKLKYLTDMGFGRAESTAALIRCGNDAGAALECCIGNS